MLKWLVAAGLFIGLILLVAYLSTSRAGYNSVPYTVIKADGPFELREYPVMAIVETPMKEGGTSGDGSFGRLFNFISGHNDKAQKISMTTPVFMHRTLTNSTMAFVMPATVKLSAMPKPNEPDVTTREVNGGQFAVLRFKGARSQANEEQALQQLENWMDEQKIRDANDPTYAYFDPPWTPGFLRRNEVMVRVKVPETKP